MKVLLRHAKTGFCFVGANDSLTEALLAPDFQAVRPALDFVVRHNSAGTQLALAESVPADAVANSSLTGEEENQKVPC